MFEYKLPKFTPRRVLSREALFAVRDLAYQPQLIAYAEHSSGIVSGCALFEENGCIGVKSGVVKYAGRLYLLQAPEKLPYRPTDEWAMLKLRFGPQRESPDFEHYIAELALDSETRLQTNELELGRFKLKAGSQLRTQYVDFKDMDTEYDTVNLLYVAYAAPQEPTLHPELLRQFAREAYPFLGENVLDVDFCGQCLAHAGVLNREYIRLYTAARTKAELSGADNERLYRELGMILHAIKTGGAPTDRRRPVENKILLV